MIQTEILDKFVQLPAKEQLEVIEAAIRLLRKNFQQIDPQPSLPGATERLAMAANALLLDYIEDPDLTIFTAIDGEDFYAEG